MMSEIGATSRAVNGVLQMLHRFFAAIDAYNSRTKSLRAAHRNDLKTLRAWMDALSVSDPTLGKLGLPELEVMTYEPIEPSSAEAHAGRQSAALTAFLHDDLSAPMLRFAELISTPLLSAEETREAARLYDRVAHARPLTRSPKRLEKILALTAMRARILAAVETAHLAYEADLAKLGISAIAVVGADHLVSLSL